MKRKTSEPNPEDPLQIRIPSHRGFHGIRSSDSRFPVTTTPRTADISCKERVKFTNLDNEDQRPPRCEFADNAKTSEYAFFKKLKEGASHKAHSYSLHKEAYQSNNSKSRNCSREKVNMVQNKRVDVRSSFLNENATPEPNMERACATLEGVHRKENDMVEEYENSLRNKGKRFTHFEETETENRHADVFHRKRQKLRQWVAETSFPEIDELCSKGYDFVSVLLSRLVPKCNENNRSRESIFCSDSPTSYVYKNHLQYRVWEPESELLGGNAISCTESDSQSVLPFKEYGLVTSGHVKEMDAFCQPNEYLIKRELSVPMLGWDFGSTKEDRNSSDLSRYGSEHRSASSASYQNHEVLRHCLEGNDDIRSEQEDISSRLLTYDDNKYGRILDDSSQARSLAHFVEDNVSIHESSAFCPRVPLDTEKAWPWLLDNSSWDRSEREGRKKKSREGDSNSGAGFREHIRSSQLTYPFASSLEHENAYVAGQMRFAYSFVSSLEML
ncbi:uncharacterized protein Pyn_06977 [Prunus yedoensis var. nudiflora]|uniref:Uncharacterized protein n=1 Tax=Prunus yedoensis var. nudiflora TaxID=2094558 RepID=A0A314ZNL7_PRUYE|nr:uncharacterized protein Pyn_06977 [Prunus yedoensis var. nudiflora]